jgi:hypothetical protein
VQQKGRTMTKRLLICLTILMSFASQPTHANSSNQQQTLARAKFLQALKKRLAERKAHLASAPKKSPITKKKPAKPIKKRRKPKQLKLSTTFQKPTINQANYTPRRQRRHLCSQKKCTVRPNQAFKRKKSLINALKSHKNQLLNAKTKKYS